MPRKTSEDAAKTRISILNTALKMFYDNGYAKTSLSEIASKLGLSKGAVYWHFNSKLDLFSSISEKISEKLTKELTPIAENIETIEDLKHFFQKFAQFLVKDNETKKYIIILFFKIEWDDEMLGQISFVKDKKLKDFIEVHLKKWQKKKLITDRISAKQSASVLVSNFYGAILSNISYNDFTDTVKASIDIFFKGLEV